MNDKELRASINDAARDLLHIALHHPPTRVTLLKVDADAFEDLAERTIFRSARGFYELNVDFSLKHVADELERLQESTPSADEVLLYGHALDLLSEHFTTAPAIFREPSRDADFLLGEITRLSPTAIPEARLFRARDIIGDIVSEAQAAADARASGELRAPITGFKELDQKIGGTLPQMGPCMILGNTGAGKTAFAMQIAASCGFPALYVTTEMAPAELFRRQMARLSNTFLGRLKSGELAPADVEAMARNAAAQMKQLAFVDSTTAFASPAFLRECARQVKGDAKSLLLIVDSLHTWTRGGNTGVSEYEALNQNLLALQRLCHELACPALVVCEQSRAAIAGGGGVNSGAGSRSIEYQAEIVFDLQAAKEVDHDNEREVQVVIAKNRHGAAGVNVKLSFNGALQRFKGKDDWGVYSANR